LALDDFKGFVLFYSLEKMVNFALNATLNSPISSVVCASTLLEGMIIRITAINVAFAGRN
jgi:hypothetical protein